MSGLIKDNWCQWLNKGRRIFGTVGLDGVAGGGGWVRAMEEKEEWWR
jgi:hypothetical protein